MNQTTNYQLSQWDAEDRILREDFNADNAKLEQALAGIAETLAKCGNCKIWATSYKGNGATTTSITFPVKPLLFFVKGGDTFLAASTIGDNAQVQGCVNVYSNYNNYFTPPSCTLTWSGNTASLAEATYREKHANVSGTTYHVIAFYTEA